METLARSCLWIAVQNYRIWEQRYAVIWNNFFLISFKKSIWLFLWAWEEIGCLNICHQTNMQPEPRIMNGALIKLPIWGSSNLSSSSSILMALICLMSKWFCLPCLNSYWIHTSSLTYGYSFEESSPLPVKFYQQKNKIRPDFQMFYAIFWLTWK